MAMPRQTQPAPNPGLLSPLEVLGFALRSIRPEQVNHPELGIQERVFCYELYHQLRVLEDTGFWPFGRARTQAELNKTAQHRLRATIIRILRPPVDQLADVVAEAMPDILVHIPGEDSENLLVLEAKREPAKDEDLRWDLAKLSLFAGPDLQYRFPVFLLLTRRHEKPADALAYLQSLGSRKGQVIHAFCYEVHGRNLATGEVRFPVEAALALFERDARARMKKRDEARQAREGLAPSPGDKPPSRSRGKTRGSARSE